MARGQFPVAFAYSCMWDTLEDTLVFGLFCTQLLQKLKIKQKEENIFLVLVCKFDCESARKATLVYSIVDVFLKIII